MTDRTELREQQAEAVALLDELLATDLPVCYWVLNHVVPRKLEGQVPNYQRSGEGTLAEVKEWAHYFGVEVDHEAWDNESNDEKVSATKTFGEIKVCIWAHVTRPAESKAKAA